MTYSVDNRNSDKKNINALNTSFTRFGRGATMNFLLCDAYNVEILPPTDMLRCIIIINDFISLSLPVTPMAFNVLIEYIGLATKLWIVDFVNTG